MEKFEKQFEDLDVHTQVTSNLSNKKKLHLLHVDTEDPLFGDLAVHHPSISCKNCKIELLGLSQTSPMTPQLCL